MDGEVAGGSLGWRPQRPDRGRPTHGKGELSAERRGPEECGRLRSDRLLGASPRPGRRSADDEAGLSAWRLVGDLDRRHPRPGRPVRHHATRASTAAGGPSNTASTSPSARCCAPIPPGRRRRPGADTKPGSPRPAPCPVTRARRRTEDASSAWRHRVDGAGVADASMRQGSTSPSMHRSHSSSACCGRW